MSNYIWNFEEGKYIEIHSIEECIKSIQVINQDHVDTIERLKAENQELRNEHYKDKKIRELTQELQKIREDCRRGFAINERQAEAIRAWKESHDVSVHGLNTPTKRWAAEGVSGGRYSYHFVPTSIGTSGVIRCNCGAEFEFQEIG